MSLVLLTQWLIIFAASLYALIKGADIFLIGAKQFGRALGMSSFVVGVLIVGMCTSLPELASSIAGALAGETAIVVANAVGSNITNILLIIGVLALFGGRIIIRQELIKTELPIFCIATALFVMTILDGSVDRLESVLLLTTFGAYVWYLLSESQNGHDSIADKSNREKFSWLSVGFMVFGIVALVVGAKFTVDMAINIATALKVPIGLVSITAVAIGTSLPELFVSIQAIRTKQTEMAIGNIFGSNVFNALVVTGIPGLLVGSLIVDSVVLELGLATMVVASIILFVSGLAKQVMRWEGFMMLVFFLFFLLKLSVFIG
jgi:cation:H+ antiporter